MNTLFPEAGYTPKNFEVLVEATHLLNTEFMERFDILHASFYKYRNGDRSMSWRDWEVLLKNVEAFISSKNTERKEILRENASAKQIGLSLVKTEVNNLDAAGEIYAYLAIEGFDTQAKVTLTKLKAHQSSNSDFFELSIGKDKGVEAIKRFILSSINKSNTPDNAELLLDIDQHSTSIHDALLKDVSKNLFSSYWDAPQEKLAVS